MTTRDQVLRWANRQRKARGLEPIEELPRGKRDEARKCPVALALGPGSAVYADKWLSEALWENPDLARSRLPRYVNDFALRFDKGCYPDLIEVGTE